jgi:hypothetical protein
MIIIIHIKGNNFNKRWKECLVRTGLDDECGISSTNEEEEPKDVLE